MRRYEEFGWTLSSSQEGTSMRGDRMQRLAKLLFTRTASPGWIEDMNALEGEFETLAKSVQMGKDGLVLLGDAPRTSPPVPILVVIAFVGYLAGWAVLDEIIGLMAGILAVLVSWFISRNRGMKRLSAHTVERRAATEAFRQRRSQLLARIRAHAATRDAGLSGSLPS